MFRWRGCNPRDGAFGELGGAELPRAGGAVPLRAQTRAGVRLARARGVRRRGRARVRARPGGHQSRVRDEDPHRERASRGEPVRREDGGEVQDAVRRVEKRRRFLRRRDTVRRRRIPGDIPGDDGREPRRSSRRRRRREDATRDETERDARFDDVREHFVALRARTRPVGVRVRRGHARDARAGVLDREEPFNERARAPRGGGAGGRVGKRAGGGGGGGDTREARRAIRKKRRTRRGDEEDKF